MTEQILKLSEVKLITGLSGSSIYRGAASGTFPKPIVLGERISDWFRLEVSHWLQKRIETSRNIGEA